MELSIIYAVLVVACTYVFYTFLQTYKKLNVFVNLGIPGPTPSFIRGNLEDMKHGSKLPLDTSMKWQKQYGKMYGYFVGTAPTLVVSDFELMKQILIKDFANFANRPKPPIDIAANAKSLIGLQDDAWKEARRTLSPTFSAKKMRQLSAVVNKKVSMFCDEIEKRCQTGEDFDMYVTFQRLTLDVIGECALALNIECQRHQDDPTFQTIQAFMKGVKSPILDLLKYLPGLTFIVKILFKYLPLVKRVEALLQQIRCVIRTRRLESTKGKAIDVLQLMLDAGHNAEVDDDGDSDDDDGEDNIKSVKYTLDSRKRRKPLTDDHIVGNCWLFLLAGYETTATALAFTAHVLTHHPDIQERLHQEIVSRIEGDKVPTYEDAHNLQYLDQVINETLRIYPPVVLFMTRVCARDYDLNGITIPAGMKIEIPIYCIHHDPELWPDPEKFDPERFSPENKSKIHPLAHIPFGAGPRNCIGMRFALLEAKLTLIRLLRNYRLVPSSKTKDPPEVTVPHATYVPKDGIFVKVERRT